MKRKCIFYLAFIVLAFSIAAEEIGPQSNLTIDDPVKKAFDNAKVILCFDNKPTSFWQDDGSGATMFITCFIIDKSRTITNSVISEINLYGTYGVCWGVNTTIDGITIGEWERRYSFEFSLDGSVLPVDNYTLELITTNNQIYQRELTLSEISPSLSATDKFIVSNEYSGTFNQGFIKALDRPSISKAIINDRMLEIEFTVNDPRIHNFDLTFYDNNLDSVVNIEYVYNGITGQILPNVNDGQDLYFDGKTNRVEFNLDTLKYLNGFTSNDITKMMITVCDQASPSFYLSKENMVLLMTSSDIVPIDTK
jgi:hypothetical protein